MLNFNGYQSLSTTRIYQEINLKAAFDAFDNKECTIPLHEAKKGYEEIEKSVKNLLNEVEEDCMIKFA